MSNTKLSNEEITSNTKSCKHPKRGKKKAIFFSFFLILLFSVAFVGFKAGKHHHWIKAKRIVKTLQLTAEQKRQLKQIFEKMQSKREKNNTEMQKFQDKMMGMLEQEKVEETSLHQLFSEGLGKMKEVSVQNSKYLVQAHSVLTPIQRRQLVKVLKKMRKHQLKKKFKQRKNFLQHLFK